MTAYENFYKNLNTTYNSSMKLIQSKPWIEEYYNVNFTVIVDEAKGWFETKKEEQHKLLLNEVTCLFFYDYNIGTYFSCRSDKQ